MLNTAHLEGQHIDFARPKRHTNITMQHVTQCKYSLFITLTAVQRRSVIVALAFAAGCNAFVAPQHPATGKALRAAAIEEEPAAPKYPTVNVIAAASDNASLM